MANSHRDIMLKARFVSGTIAIAQSVEVEAVLAPKVEMEWPLP
jgi:hypothetical protein